MRVAFFAFDLDLRGSYAQPIEDEGLEDMVCDLVLGAVNADSRGGESDPPRFHVPARSSIATLVSGFLGSSLAHEAVPRTIAPRRRAAAHCLIYILLC